MAIVASTVAALLACGSAQTFRGSVVSANATRADLKAEFVKLGGAEAEIIQHQEWLRPLYNALPKDAMGNLEPQSARYALHRLFTGKFGWHLKGFEPEGSGKAWSSSIHEDSVEDWAPPALLGVLQEQTGSQGISLEELGILGAAVKLQTFTETTEFMDQLYQQLELSKAPQSGHDVRRALFYYVTRFLSDRVYPANLAVLLAERNTRNYHGWSEVEAWYKAIEEKHLGDASMVNFSTAVGVAIDVGERYAEFNEKQCQDLKEGLMGQWSKAKTTGRVRLTDFYRFGLQTQWDLEESAGYLKSVGALDDSNASAPMVIIPNYLTLRHNCLQATQLYGVCCRNECESFLARLEKSLGTHEAAPGRIIELVEEISSASTSAEGGIPFATQERLWQIAERHGGKVKLHGRLFAQWMHHVYPNECPFPHDKAYVHNLNDTWDGAEDVSEEARTAMVEAETCGSEEAAEQWEVEVPWSETEVLLSGAATVHPGASRRRRGAGIYLAGLLLAALVALHLPQASSVRQRLVAQAVVRGWSETKLTIMALLVAAMLADLVNRVLLFIVLCVVAFGSHNMVKTGSLKSKKEKELELP